MIEFLKRIESELLIGNYYMIELGKDQITDINKKKLFYIDLKKY